MKSFSLVIIRNEFKKRPDKFLLRYDERWECWLLPYYKNTDVEALRQHLSDDLYIDANVIVSKGEQIVEKCSPADKKIKAYHHKYYYVLPMLNRFHKQDEFTVGNLRYKWFSLDDMNADETIMKMNGDVVEVLTKLVY